MKFRSKPKEIEAVRWLGSNWPELSPFVGDKATAREGIVMVSTLEGTMVANPGDWIIKGIHGEFYPCKPEIFEKSYEAIK